MANLRSPLRCGILWALPLASVLAPAGAGAQSVEHVRANDEDHVYPIEIEPHFTFGAANVYGGMGYGAGVRLSVPFVAGHVGRFPQNLALSVGGEVVHYESCYFADRCGASYLFAPVAAQYNLFVAPRVSVFGDGGVYVYKGFFGGCVPGAGHGCDAPSDFGVLPTIAVGGRLHLSDGTSFTARIGYPTITFGVSIL
jgi:hypothetical protein